MNTGKDYCACGKYELDGYIGTLSDAEASHTRARCVPFGPAVTPAAKPRMSDAFNPRTDKMLHFIHDSLFGVGGLEDLVAHEMPFPKCVERHDTDKHLGRWACDAAEWALAAATRHPEIMAALNERAGIAPAAKPRKHTTHFDDCGCLSERYQREIADANAAILRLQRRLDAVRPVVAAAIPWRGMHSDERFPARESARVCLVQAVDALPADVREWATKGE